MQKGRKAQIYRLTDVFLATSQTYLNTNRCDLAKGNDERVASLKNPRNILGSVSVANPVSPAAVSVLSRLKQRVARCDSGGDGELLTAHDLQGPTWMLVSVLLPAVSI